MGLRDDLGFAENPGLEVKWLARARLDKNFLFKKRDLKRCLALIKIFLL